MRTVLIWPACTVEGSVHEGNVSHPVTLGNWQTVFHWEAQVVFGSQVPRGVCTGRGPSSCPYPMPRRKDLKTGTVRDYERVCRFKPWRQEELGPVTRAGTAYHDHTMLLWEAHSAPHNVTAQMAPVNNIQLLMLVKQTGKHHSLRAPTVHTTHGQ